MPRTARKKSSESLYHIMSRSISEINLFQCNEDKDYYLLLLKKYISKYHCSIYAYCLMDNHVHLYINSQGYDISRFMHCLNSAYVNYFNRRYKRHGHLFQGRFASNIVTTDVYSLTLSAYIHNNPKDVQGYDGREEDYPYSSLGIYIGKRKNNDGLVDTSFVLSVFSNNKKKAAQKYYEFTKMMKGTGIMTEIDDDIMEAYTENEYRNEKEHIERNVNPNEVVRMVCELTGESSTQSIRMKHCREKSHIRALTVYGIRLLCGYTFKKICQYIGDMSLSGIIRLANQGYIMCQENLTYQTIFKTGKLAV